MKKLVLSILALLAIGIQAKAQNVNIPDANFKSALIANNAINTNGDTEIQLTEASTYSGSIVLVFPAISDLTGVEEFTQLTELSVVISGMTTVDLSQNTNLNVLKIGGYSGQPASLNAIDVSNNTLLTSLNISSTSIASLDVSTNILLEELYTLQTQLSSLNVSTCPLLTNLYVQEAQLTTLDVSANPLLSYLDCSDNQLTSLDISNGNISALISFNATANPNLNCIKTDDVVWCFANYTTVNNSIDPVSTFSFDCNQCYVNIPDPNFKAYLTGNTSININGDTEIECAEALLATAISCIGQNISDLTGVEAFTSITTLRFDNNQVSAVDLSTNINLEWLGCENNQLVSLDLTANVALDYVQLDDNLLTDVNIVNGNNMLIPLNGLSASNNPNLTCIQVDDVNYSTTNWTYIDPQTSYSTNCSVGQCIVTIPDANFKTYLLGESAINTNGDAEIQCTEASAFNGTIDCGYLNISDLTGIEGFTSLTTLNCYGNLFTSIDLTSNSALTHFNCDDNSLTTLNVAQNSALTQLVCSNNSIASLDLSGNPSLTELDCNWNSLASLNVSANLALTNLICYNNSISMLDISSNSSIVALNCTNNSLTILNIANANNTNLTIFFAYNNPNLTCITVDDIAYSTANWSGGEVDSQTSFSTSCSVANGIKETKIGFLKIYPNPVQSELFIEIDEGQISKMEILEFSGKVLRSITKENSNNIDVSALNQGVYFLKVYTANGVSTNRFVKQ